MIAHGLFYREVTFHKTYGLLHPLYRHHCHHFFLISLNFVCISCISYLEQAMLSLFFDIAFDILFSNSFRSILLAISNSYFASIKFILSAKCLECSLHLCSISLPMRTFCIAFSSHSALNQCRFFIIFTES